MSGVAGQSRLEELWGPRGVGGSVYGRDRLILCGGSVKIIKRREERKTHLEHRTCFVQRISRQSGNPVSRSVIWPPIPWTSRQIEVLYGPWPYTEVLRYRLMVGEGREPVSWIAHVLVIPSRRIPTTPTPLPEVIGCALEEGFRWFMAKYGVCGRGPQPTKPG
jgi:hypothetical protein